MYGDRPHPLRIPVDLDALLIGETVSRQVSPSAIRRVSAEGGYFGIASRSPVRQLSSAIPQTLGFALQAPAQAPRGTTPAPLTNDPFDGPGLAVRTGR